MQTTLTECTSILPTRQAEFVICFLSDVVNFLDKSTRFINTDTFDMYMHMFSLCLPPHHHQQWRRPSAASTKVGGRLRRPPTFVESIVGDGEAANIAKTYAYTYQMCPYFYILLIYLDHFGIGLGSVGGRFEVGLTSVWIDLGVGLGSVWGPSGVGLGSVWGRFGVSLGLVLGIRGVNKDR